MKYNTEFSNLGLEEKFLGYASAYELCVTFMAEYSNQEKPENKSSNLWSEYFVEDLEDEKKHVETLINIIKKYENTDFGKNLINGPANLAGPPGKEKLKLGFAHIQLVIATLGNRLYNIIGKIFRTLEPTVENCYKITFNYKQSNVLTEFAKELLPLYEYFNDDIIEEVNQKMIKLCQMAQKYKVKIPNNPRGSGISQPFKQTGFQREYRKDYRYPNRGYQRDDNKESFGRQKIVETPNIVWDAPKLTPKSSISLPSITPTSSPGSVCSGPWGDFGKIKEIKETLEVEKILKKTEKPKEVITPKFDDIEEKVEIQDDEEIVLQKIIKKEKVEDDDGWVSYTKKEIKKIKRKTEEEKIVIDEDFELNPHCN